MYMVYVLSKMPLNVMENCTIIFFLLQKTIFILCYHYVD